MNRTKRWIGIMAALTLSTEAARGELVSYSFTGTDTLTGTPAFGSFTYQTNTPAHIINPDETILVDVGGSLTITAGGRTYSTSAVGGVLQANGLALLHSDQTNIGFGVLLASADSSTAFPTLSFLPPKLDLANLRGSMFIIRDSNTLTDLSRGPIALLAPLATAAAAPEPNALTLAVVALATASVLLRWRQLPLLAT